MSRGPATEAMTDHSPAWPIEPGTGRDLCISAIGCAGIVPGVPPVAGSAEGVARREVVADVDTALPQISGIAP